MTTDTITQRVARGAAWLDENEPGWRDAIEPKTLYLASACHCVLGQVFSGVARDSIWSWGYSWARHEKVGGSYPEMDAWAVAHGFLSLAEGSLEDEGEWGDLKSEWLRVVHASRVPAEQREATHV